MVFEHVVLALMKPAQECFVWLGAPAASLSSPLARIESGLPASLMTLRMPEQQRAAVRKNRSDAVAQVQKKLASAPAQP